MRKVRAIGLLALLVVGVTAAMGAATASASSNFAASSYPVTINGTANGPQELNAGNYPGECQLALSGGYLPGPQEGISLDPSGKCIAFGLSDSLNANGCKFELNPDWNTYAIGPKGCGPMTVQLFTCKISIPSQQGLAAEYGEVAGSPQKIKFTSTTNHLKYSKSGCGASSTSEGGSLLGSWNLAAAGGVESVYLETSSHGGAFEAESYPASFSGSQTASGLHQIKTETGPVECNKATFSGTASSGSSTLTLSPAYSECKGFGFLSATVNTNGCTFVYHAAGTQDIACPAGSSMVVTASTCTVSIPAQVGLGTTSYDNVTVSGHEAISVGIGVGGMTYNVTKDGFLCPFAGTGARTNGGYTGETLLQGFDSEGSLQNIREGD